MTKPNLRERIDYYMSGPSDAATRDPALEALRFYVAMNVMVCGEVWASVFAFWAIVAEGYEPEHAYRGAAHHRDWYSFLVGYFRAKKEKEGTMPPLIEAYFSEHADIPLDMKMLRTGQASYSFVTSIERLNLAKIADSFQRNPGS